MDQDKTKPVLKSPLQTAQWPFPLQSPSLASADACSLKLFLFCMQGYLSCYYYFFFLFCFVKTKHLHLDVHQRLLSASCWSKPPIYNDKNSAKNSRGTKFWIGKTLSHSSGLRHRFPFCLSSPEMTAFHSVLSRLSPVSATSCSCQSSCLSTPLSLLVALITNFSPVSALDSTWCLSREPQQDFPGLEGRWLHRDKLINIQSIVQQGLGADLPSSSSRLLRLFSAPFRRVIRSLRLKCSPSPNSWLYLGF